MKHVDEYRDRRLVETLTGKIRSELSREWTIMEICGGQTHNLMKYGLVDLLPREITMVHGPGCPVCVTPENLIDKARQIAIRENSILTTFGDMLRVPGIEGDLSSARSEGGRVRMVYSPLDALRLAENDPASEVVFFAVGFETTAPAVALALREARRRSLDNFSILTAHVLVPPAIHAILSDPAMQIDGFLAPGHVCTVSGTDAYEDLARDHGVPIVVTGFEPVDLLLGIWHCVRMLEEGRKEVENAYPRSVKKEGNPAARQLLEEVFEVCDRSWRGIGSIPMSGYRLREPYQRFDAENRFVLKQGESMKGAGCIAGDVLKGIRKPTDCKSFGKDCTPEHPLGAPMVSSEGACSAYFSYKMK